MNHPDRLFIVWKRECHRSSMMAQTFGMDIEYVYPLASRGVAGTALRYFLSSFLTIGILARRRPHIVFCLNQPIMLIAIVYAYAVLFSARFGLDAHSRPYGWPPRSLRRHFYDMVARRAIAVVNHNADDLAASSGAGAKAHLLPVVVSAISYSPQPLPASEKPFVLVSSSFAADEPVEVVFAAARLTPGIELRLTGNSRKCAPEILATRPDNVTLLGFVSRDVYYSQMVAANAVMTLSTRAHIMQMAAEESMCLGCALVTNKSPILESCFGDGALYVGLTAEAIAEAIRLTVADTPARKQAMNDARRRYSARFDKEVAEISSRFS